jgi:6-phosphofructokinase 1
VLAAKCIELLSAEAFKTSPAGALIGLQAGHVKFSSLEDLPRMLDEAHQLPKEQWWMELRPIARVLAQPGPRSGQEHDGAQASENAGMDR